MEKVVFEETKLNFGHPFGLLDGSLGKFLR